jgi:adenylosuccinate lyase
VISLHSILRGLDKLILNESALKDDLENNWTVVAEAIQTILRREGYPDPFNALKALTRTHEKMTQEKIFAFIDSLKVAEEIKNELKKITPFNYTGRFQL